MKDWHLCRRWTERGIACPFRLLEMVEERQDEEPDRPDEGARGARHFALAEEAVPVTVLVNDERAIKNWHGYADAGRALTNSGLVEAVSTLVVPPFEEPIGNPVTYIGGQEGLHNNGDEIVKAIGLPIEAEAVDPRHVERVLAETLSRAGERGIGARQSASTDAALLEQQERERAAVTKIQQTPFVNTPSPIAEAYRLEMWAAAALGYGLIESIKAIRNARIKVRATDSFRQIVPKPILQGRPRTPRGLGSGSGDVPGILQEFRAGLNLKDNP